MISLKTKIPGPIGKRILNNLKRVNGGWNYPHPIVFSGKGSGAYVEDIDKNVFLDFGSQICSNPLGYNNPELLELIKKYSSRSPIKYAGQDFVTEEHLNLIESLLKISPKNLNSAFLINSGGEAVENAIKICMHERPKMKFSVSLDGAFHGRTLGALSLHHSKPIQREGFILEPNKKLPFDDSAPEKLQEMINKDKAESIGFVILEHFQGEGGYRIPSEKMVKGIRKICHNNNISYISDEVQAGMGRTGKWWAFQHYNIKPDVFSVAKALQVGATVANKKIFPPPGAISSTWGGGHIIDLALGTKTIEIIKKKNLLQKNRTLGYHVMKELKQINNISNVRGRGLMIGFDLQDTKKRDELIEECTKNGLIIMGAGQKSIRLTPPYIIEKSSVDEGIRIIEKVIKTIS